MLASLRQETQKSVADIYTKIEASAQDREQAHVQVATQFRETELNLISQNEEVEKQNQLLKAQCAKLGIQLEHAEVCNALDYR